MSCRNQYLNVIRCFNSFVTRVEVSFVKIFMLVKDYNEFLVYLVFISTANITLDIARKTTEWMYTWNKI